MNITTEMILDKHPCPDWTEKRIAKHIGKGKTLLQIAKLKLDIPDIFWCITQFLPDDLNRKFAIWCARQCETNIPEIKNYIDVIEKYYAGKATREELNCADWAAYWAADMAAGWAADMAAYRAAGRAADWTTDGAAMRKKQLAKLIEIIREAK